MKNPPTIQPGSLFIRCSMVLIAILLLVVGFFSKTSSFIAANPWHTPALDSFFTYYTYLGDGLFAVLVVAVFFIFRKIDLGIKLLLSFLLSGLLAQLLKKLFHMPRPMACIDGHAYTHFINGVTHSGMTSFPSGHATTAFALAATLAFSLNCRIRAFVLFLLATGVIYSRVYLGQHFVMDVLAGTILGVLTALLVEYLYFHYISRIGFIKRSSSTHEQPIIGV